jgi:hypothetical protein
VEMDFSEYKTKQQVEMDFSEYKSKKQVKMYFSMTTQKPVKWVKTTDVVLMAVRMMMLQIATILRPTLTSRRTLRAFTAVKSHPSDVKVAPPVSRETFIYT